MKPADDARVSASWQYVAAAVVLSVLGWYAFVRGVRVPLLGAADLGFHEFGHMLFMWAPPPIQAVAGSATQVCVPLGLTAYFLRRRDTFAGALMLGWAATAAQDVSVYIADAPYERLPLIGGYHDWAFLLGPGVFDALDAADELAAVVWGLGLLMLLAGYALCVVAVARGPIEARRAEKERARLATLPVHEPRSRPPRLPDDASGETSCDADEGRTAAS